MELVLVRRFFRPDGIFGTLFKESGGPICYTAEHAYEDHEGFYVPKVPEGQYNLLKGSHVLKGMTEAFETYELQGVPGHFGILFHPGNIPVRDSDGCILTATEVNTQDENGWVLKQSKIAFQKLMFLQKGTIQSGLKIIRDDTVS